MNGFHVALTADNASPDGSTVYGDLGLDRLTDAGLTWSVLETSVDPLSAGALRGANAVLSLGGTRFEASVVDRCPDLELVARFGAGYDSIDVPACTRAGVIVTTTPDAIRRPLALASLTMLLAVAHQLRMKDAVARSGDWSSRGSFRGAAMSGATVGLLGFGSVAAELARLLQPTGVRILGTNRSGASAVADELRVPLVPLEQLMTESDFVVVLASLNPGSRHLVDEHALSLMKPTGYLVNMARGAVVDQAALTRALSRGRIAGAGLDVLDPEPVAVGDPLLGLDNVTLSPHALNWTEDFLRDVSASAFDAILTVAAGGRPAQALDASVFESAAYAAKLTRRGAFISS